MISAVSEDCSDAVGEKATSSLFTGGMFCLASLYFDATQPAWAHSAAATSTVMTNVDSGLTREKATVFTPIVYALHRGKVADVNAWLTTSSVERC